MSYRIERFGNGEWIFHIGRAAFGRRSRKGIKRYWFAPDFENVETGVGASALFGGNSPLTAYLHYRKFKRDFYEQNCQSHRRKD